jgi:hypothetical protein
MNGKSVDGIDEIKICIYNSRNMYAFYKFSADVGLQISIKNDGPNFPDIGLDKEI